MDDELIRLLETIEAAHAPVAAAIAALPDHRALDRVMGHWTRKDLVAHIGWWHGHSVAVIDALTAGLEPYDRDDVSLTTDAINARVHAEHLTDTLEQARAFEAETYQRLLARIAACAPTDLFDATRFAWTRGQALVETIRWDTDRHYPEHLDGLRV